MTIEKGQLLSLFFSFLKLHCSPYRRVDDDRVSTLDRQALKNKLINCKNLRWRLFFFPPLHEVQEEASKSDV